MSKETMEWLNTYTVIGFTEKRGNAWHYREGASNHYPEAVPLPVVSELLNRVKPVSNPMPCACGCGDDSQEIIDANTGHRFGIFKSGWQMHPYEEWLVNNVSHVLDDALAVGSAGLLRKGAQAWVSVEVPDTIKTPEGVEYRPNLLAVTSFDGSLATTYKRVITNVVCDNTMAAGLSESGQLYKRKHTRNSAGTLQIAEAREALAIVHTMSEDFEAEVKALTQWEITDKEWFTFLEKHVPDTDPKTGKVKEKAALTKVINQRDQLTGMYRNDMRVAPWAGTAWGVLQAVNTYVHHESTFKGGNRVERNMDRMVSSSKTESVFALDSGVIQTLATVTGKELVMA